MGEVISWRSVKSVARHLLYANWREDFNVKLFYDFVLYYIYGNKPTMEKCVPKLVITNSVYLFYKVWRKNLKIVKKMKHNELWRKKKIVRVEDVKKIGEKGWRIRKIWRKGRIKKIFGMILVHALILSISGLANAPNLFSKVSAPLSNSKLLAYDGSLVVFLAGLCSWKNDNMMLILERDSYLDS